MEFNCTAKTKKLMLTKRLQSALYKRRHLFLLVFLFSGTIAYSQNQISGTVRNSNGDPLSSVSVALKGSTTGTVTGGDGKFSLNVPDLNGTLVFTLVGYTTQEQSLGGETELSLVLEEEVETLKGVVVVGYGRQSRETVTTSITKLDKKVLENIPYTNVATAMQGTMAGVQVQTTSGQPGAAPRIIVRGGTSINNANGAAP